MNPDDPKFTAHILGELDELTAAERTEIEALRRARGVLDQYEALWRGRIDRMTDLIAATRGDQT